MGIVFDASSLIFLQEVGLIDGVRRLGIELCTTAEVLDEVPYITVRNLVQNGEIRLVVGDISKIPPFMRFGLGPGEITVISFVVEHGTYWAVLDDKRARRAANRLNIRFLGTARLIKHLSDRGILTSDRARKIIESLPRFGFFIDPATIQDVLNQTAIDL